MESSFFNLDHICVFFGLFYFAFDLIIFEQPYAIFGKGEVFRLLSSGMILPLNIAIAFKVSSSLFLVFSALAIFRRRSFRAMIEDELA